MKPVSNVEQLELPIGEDLETDLYQRFRYKKIYEVKELQETGVTSNSTYVVVFNNEPLYKNDVVEDRLGRKYVCLSSRTYPRKNIQKFKIEPLYVCHTHLDLTEYLRQQVLEFNVIMADYYTCWSVKFTK